MPVARACVLGAAQAQLLTGSDDARCLLYDVGSGQQLASLEGHTSWVLGLAFSPDDAQFVSCSSDHSVKVWDVHSPPKALALSPTF